MMNLSQLRGKLAPLLADFRLAQKQVAQEKNALLAAQEHVHDVLEAQQIIQTVAQEVQQSVHKQVASVVTKCLEAVFDDPYQFRIDFQKKRAKTEAVLTLVRDELVLDDPQNSSGGGVVDLVSFSLRLVSILLSRPKKRRLLLLDEPMKMLSWEYSPKARELIQMLCEEMGFQIVMVTHNPNLACGKIIDIEGIL